MRPWRALYEAQFLSIFAREVIRIFIARKKGMIIFHEKMIYLEADTGSDWLFPILF
jgi:hypothetical protein